MTIHQEVHIKGSPKNIYELLLDSTRFQAMTGGRAAHISTHEGGEVSMFGGDIEARNVELVPNRRIVQAWRSRVWPEGTYSIVRFELQADGTGTRLTFDQAGYPRSAHATLDEGWPKMYWEPMNRALTHH
ncbi:SRPBCC domain-containing protein [Aminobacter sp. AP02]|uniref:SRPBCC domain-containing protein n=1 Tax=Aminobacter sp. AP02 TaxID=2135737 RepID=UPI000D7A78F0|nr:SRPBCC domain-containing protein [Aminobacter sp. AP02]PWK70538.1 activator of Hsp90 ATPase-like protein [Aminobacter sp. AP02]